MSIESVFDVCFAPVESLLFLPFGLPLLWRFSFFMLVWRPIGCLSYVVSCPLFSEFIICHLIAGFLRSDEN